MRLPFPEETGHQWSGFTDAPFLSRNIPQGQGDGHSRTASTSYCPHSLLTCSTLPYQPLFHVCTPLPYYSSYNWLSYHTRTISFTHMHFLHNNSFSQDDQTTSKSFFSPVLLHHINPFSQGPMLHLSYMISLLSASHPPILSLSILLSDDFFHSTHSWLLFLILCPNLWSICQCWQGNTVL